MSIPRSGDSSRTGAGGATTGVAEGRRRRAPTGPAGVGGASAASDPGGRRRATAVGVAASGRCTRSAGAAARSEHGARPRAGTRSPGRGITGPTSVRPVSSAGRRRRRAATREPAPIRAGDAQPAIANVHAGVPSATSPTSPAFTPTGCCAGRRWSAWRARGWRPRAAPRVDDRVGALGDRHVGRAEDAGVVVPAATTGARPSGGEVEHLLVRVGQVGDDGRGAGEHVDAGRRGDVPDREPALACGGRGDVVGEQGGGRGAGGVQVGDGRVVLAGLQRQVDRADRRGAGVGGVGRGDGDRVGAGGQVERAGEVPGVKSSSVRSPLTQTSTVRPGTPCRTESLAGSAAWAGTAAPSTTSAPAPMAAARIFFMVPSR